MRRSRSWRRFGRRAAASSPTTSSSPPACPAAARPRPSQRATSSSRANQRCSRAPARWSGKTRASRRTRRSPREPSSSRSAEPRRRWARRRERRRPSSGWGTATRTTNSRKAARGRSGTTRRGATGTCFYFFIHCLFVSEVSHLRLLPTQSTARLSWLCLAGSKKAEGEEGRGKGGRD